MSRPVRDTRPPNRYDPASISAMPQWASAPFSPSPTPPRQPVVYLTGNHVVPDVGLGTTVVAPPNSAVAAPTTVVAPEYWGNDENTVFVETLTDASKTSLRWEQEQLENTVVVSATGKGVRTIFHNGE